MRRLFLGVILLATLAACTDSTPTGTRAPALKSPRATVSTADQSELLAEIADLIAFWPKSLAKSFTSKWNDVLKLYQAGLTDPAKAAEAKKKLAELATLILKNASLANPNTGTPEEAAEKLILDMVLYVYGGSAGGDNVTGLLLPDQELTLITPRGWAGLHFGVGSTNVPRIIVVTQNGNEDYPVCDGPLLTELCQYPLFYNIESFPGGRLLQLAQVAICHPPEGSERGPSAANHPNLRLAHTKPAKAADYTPNSSIRDTPASQENIEILPWGLNLSLTGQLDCDGADYPTPVIDEGPVSVLQRGLRLASAFASRVGKFLTPKSAYAIDQGAGGSFLSFSPFNYVDICSSANPEPSCIIYPD